MDNLIIVAELTNPPTYISSFRDLTLFTKSHVKLNILLECETDYTDIYYGWLKKHGAMDFVDDFIQKNQESGIRLDRNGDYSMTVVVEKIVPENILNILGQISNLCRF